VGYLPHRANAHVDDAKLGYYMDEARRADTGSKVGIFRGILGFMDGESARAALVSHAQTHEAFVMRQNEHGVIWNVIGPMSGPSGRTTIMRTGWIIHHGSRTPVNTTAFRERPGRG